MARIIRLTQSDLIDHVQRDGTEKQYKLLLDCTGMGWSVEKICPAPSKRLAVFVRHHQGRVAAILPDGEFRRAPNGQKTVRVDLAKI